MSAKHSDLRNQLARARELAKPPLYVTADQRCNALERAVIILAATCDTLLDEVESLDRSVRAIGDRNV